MDIANDEKTKRSLRYAFGLCSIGWFTLHILISINVLVFTPAETSGGRELAVTLSGSFGNGVLFEYSFTSSDSNVKVSKSGNKLTITSSKAVDGTARITAARNNTPKVSSGAMMIAYGDPNLQDVITGVENVDTMMAYETGTRHNRTVKI